MGAWTPLVITLAMQAAGAMALLTPASAHLLARQLWRPVRAHAS